MFEQETQAKMKAQQDEIERRKQLIEQRDRERREYLEEQQRLTKQ